MIARLDPLKDHQTFLNAVHLLAATGVQIRILLIGPNAEPTNRELSALIKVRGLSRLTTLLGERHDTEQLLPAMDIAALSSYSEGFPNVLAEAMASGVPCVATDVGDSREIIGDTGRVVPPRSPAAFAAALGDLVSLGFAGRKELGQFARKRVADNWSMPGITLRYADFYRKLSRQRGRRS